MCVRESLWRATMLTTLLMPNFSAYGGLKGYQAFARRATGAENV